MIVYLAFNNATEMSYVGATKLSLEQRRRNHYNFALKNKTGVMPRFTRALVDWPAELWEWYVLEECASLEELDAAEQRWIQRLHTLEPNVGYNSYDGRYLKTIVPAKTAIQRKQFTDEERAQLARNARSGRAPTAAQLEKRARKEAFKRMSPEEQREFFRTCGRKAIDPNVSKKQRVNFKEMTDEQRREYLRACGRKGAAAYKRNLFEKFSG